MKPNVLSEGPFVREKGLRQREGPTSERRAYVREKGLRQREGPTSKRTAYIREKDLRQGEGPKLKTLDFALYIGSTSTFCISTLPTQHTKFNNIINALCCTSTENVNHESWDGQSKSSNIQEKPRSNHCQCAIQFITALYPWLLNMSKILENNEGEQKMCYHWASQNDKKSHLKLIGWAPLIISFDLQRVRQCNHWAARTQMAERSHSDSSS